MAFQRETNDSNDSNNNHHCNHTNKVNRKDAPGCEGSISGRQKDKTIKYSQARKDNEEQKHEKRRKHL